MVIKGLEIVVRRLEIRPGDNGGCKKSPIRLMIPISVVLKDIYLVEAKIMCYSLTII